MTTAAAGSASTTSAAGAGASSVPGAAATPGAGTAAAVGAAGAVAAAPVAPVGSAGAPAQGADDSLITEAAAAAAVQADIEIKLPEGVKADDSLLEGFKPIAKELGLKSDGAQKLVDLYAATMARNAKTQNDAFVAQQSKWKDEVKADKEVGGQNFEASKVEVNRFFSAFDKDGSIRKGIAQLGLGNHPALVKLAVRAAKLIREDSGSGAGASGNGEPSDEDVLRARYPTMFQ